MKSAHRAALAAAVLIGAAVPSYAGLQVIGPGISGDYDVSNGTTLWSLVGGVTTSTPPGYNSKNAILRYYVVADGAAGRSVFSLGELDPRSAEPDLRRTSESTEPVIRSSIPIRAPRDAISPV
jgi:hypothetical protein